MSLYSATQNLKTSLRASREAILGRGGEISATAGFKDFPLAIANIPNDISLAFYEDSDIAYRKIVPEKMEAYAMLKKLGGMTYKSKNLANLLGWSATSFWSNSGALNLSNQYGTTINTTEPTESIVVTQSSWVEGSGVGTVNGQFFCKLEKNLVEGKTYKISVDVEVTNSPLSYPSLRCQVDSSPFVWFDGLSLNKKVRVSASFVYADNGIDVHTLFFSLGGNSIILSNPMITEDTVTDTTYEPYFEGLRDSKVTELVSEGKNLFDISKALNEQLADNGDGTYTITHNGGYNRFSKEVPMSIPANTPIAFRGTPISKDVKAQIQIKFAGAPSNPSYYIDGWGRALTFSYDIVGIVVYINSGLDGQSATFADFQVEYGSSSTKFKPFVSGDTKPIPEAVQALEGYGLGVNAEYNNHIEWRDGRAYFVKKCERIVLDGLQNIVTVDIANTPSRREYVIDFSDRGHNYKLALNNSDTVNLAATHYTPSTRNQQWGRRNEYLIAVGGLYLRWNDDYMSAEEMKAKLKAWYDEGNPLTVVYALAEPIETDITHLFTEDNFIKVEGGGTITMVNEYEYAVPTTIRYTRKVES